MAEEYALELENVSLGYGEKRIVSKATLKIKAGQVVSILGPNGCGKTTLLKAIIKQLSLQEGRILILQKDARLYSAAEYAKNISVLLTKRITAELATAFDVAAMGRYPYTGLLGLLSERDKKITEECLKSVGAQDFMNEAFAYLSDGQKQRVMIARALCQEPKILVLDEPTAYLDIKQRLDFLALIRTLAAKGMCVIMVLHEIDLAQKISDIIVGIKKSNLLQVWDAENLFLSQDLCSLYDVDSKLYNPLLGTCEIESCKGPAQFFVISSSGSGIPIYRKLTKKNISFSTGIIFENDIDFFFAKSLAATCISEKAFAQEISESCFFQAKDEIDKVQKVLLTNFAIGKSNEKVRDLIEYAKSRGKLCRDL